MFSLVVLAFGVLGLAGWTVHRWRRIPATVNSSLPVPSSMQKQLASANLAVEAPIEAIRLNETHGELAERLWRLAYSAPAQAQPLDRAQSEIRVAIVSRLEPETLDPDYFPRRPALLQQLLRAVDDPHAEADKLARMIAHDPVITADVLRIANSSLYRVAPEPIESIQRAIVLCGVDSLRGILATAMVRPVFRATRTNFPRLPRLLWDRTERATRAAELYAMTTHPQDRFEAQLAVLLSALGPLVVYSAALDAYAQRPRLTPNPSLLVELTMSLGAKMSRRIAQQWGASTRLIAALDKSGSEFLSTAMLVGELLGTLGVLEAQSVVSPDERRELETTAGIDVTVLSGILENMTPG